MKIVSHKLEPKLVTMFRKSIERRLPRFVEIAKTKNYKTAARVAELSMESVAISCSLGEREQNRDGLAIALSALCGLLDISTRPDEEFYLNINGQSEVKFKADEDERLTYANWLNAFYLALILRDREALERLYSLDVSSSSSLNAKDHLVIGLQSFYYLYSAGRDAGRAEQLFGYMTEIIERHFVGGFYLPDVDEFPYPNYFFSYNRALIMKAIVEGNQDEFSRNLLEGLKFHQTYWGRSYGLNEGDPPMHDDPRGLISWPLTALAALAYDRGLKIEVESGYIPLEMIEGSVASQGE